MQLEDSKTLRRWGRLPYLKYTQNIKKHWFWLWRDGFRGVDYKAQAALVEDLYEDTFDSDGDTKVPYAFIGTTWTLKQNGISEC